MNVVLNDKEVIRLLKELKKTSSNLKPFFIHTAIPIIAESTSKNFRAGGRPQRWEALRPLTIANRMANHGQVTKHALGQNILIQQGTLMQSAIQGTVRTITSDSLEYGTNLKYAAIHQFGGTIRPINARALTVPLPAATLGRRARDYKNTFVAKGVIFQKQGSEIVPLFVLKKSVKIPARPFMVWQDEDIYKLQRNLSMFILEPEKYTALGVK